MRLEGTLDAFSLPDIFSLLSMTKKTGTLHLHRARDGELPLHGAVHLREGAVTGARADVARQELCRRLLGTGLVDDEALASAAEEITTDDSLSLARLLADKADLAADQAQAVAVEQMNDAIFSLLRWNDGEFAFVMDEVDPDDLGATQTVDQLVAEGQRRLAAWVELVEQVPAPDAVVSVHPSPAGELTSSREEWALLSLVDGRRTVADLVVLSGQGEYAVVSALAGLVGRGLLVVGTGGDDQLLRRQSLLAALEGTVVVPELPAPRAPGRASPAAAAPVIPERPEPFAPARRPEHAEPTPSYARASSGGPTALTTTASAHGSVDGATALQVDPAIASLIERDPSVNKSLLLRLIAGVRGL